ncbi:MAG: Ig domain-containing protein, partial [Actinomycetota bacterium]|nr:Ig domain-containing protein [Actinomycetota bacterium]
MARVAAVLSLLALVVTPSALAIRFTDDSYQVPTGVVGSYYSHQFRGDGGCGPALPYQFTILSGALPSGLSLASDGLVSGVPTKAGSWSFWLELSDQDPPSASWCRPAQSQREFRIEIAPGNGRPGVQVGPTLPGNRGGGSSGGSVSGGGESHPAFWDIPGQIKKAIDDWFRHLVTDALNPALELVGQTLLSTPQVVSADRVGELWAYSLGIADALLVLLIVIAGALVMGHETVQSRYALKDALPRLAFAAIVANASLALSGQLIGIANAFSFGFLASGVDPTQASASLKQFIIGAVASGGIFLIFLGLACAVVAVILLVLYIVRAALIVVLVCAAPLMLIAHALPQTEGLARLWWRGMTAALGVQVAQAFLLATAVRVFFTSEGHSALGLSVTGSLIDLLVALCLLWLLVKVPFWAKELAFSHRPSLAVR